MPTTIGMFVNLAGDDGEVSKRSDEFRRGLGPLTNLTIEPRHGGDGNDQIVNYGTYPGKAGDLASLTPPPNLYVCSCWPILNALIKVRTPATSIVFAGLLDLTADPASDFSKYLKVFGFIDYGTNLCIKWPALLSTIAPDVKRAAVVYDKGSTLPNKDLAYIAINSARGSLKGTLQMDLDYIDVRNLAEIGDFATCKNRFKIPTGGGPCTQGGLIVAGGTPMATTRKKIINAAKVNNLPAVYSNRMYVIDGGLISMGTYSPDLYLKAGRYAKQILNGTPPTPRIDVTQTGANAVFETAVNLKTAKALSTSILANAKAIPADYTVPES